MLDAGLTFLTVVGGFAVTCFLIIVVCSIWVEVQDRRAAKDEISRRRASRINAENEEMERLHHLVKAKQDIWLRAGRAGWTPRLSAAWSVLHEMIEEERASL
jgi:Na+-transporting methylmalonyl-CoA/oxaloacetate decarboxylase gamma subunit